MEPVTNQMEEFQ